MASTNYAPEIKAAMAPGQSSTKRKKRNTDTKGDPGDTPADMARDRRMGITEDSPRDVAIDARNAPNTAPPRIAHNAPPDAHHVAMATSIAHAILGKQSGGY